MNALSPSISMNAKEIRTTIGIIGNVISLFISLSQMPKVIEIYKTKTVEKFKQYRHVVMLAKCSLWALYGLPHVHKDSILVTTSNGVGFVIEVIYLVVFFIYNDKESRRQSTATILMLEFGFVAFLYLMTVGYIEPLSARVTLVGVICSVYTIIMHVLLGVQTMCATGKCSYMPFLLSFVSFINVGIWTAYSLIYKIDIYILIVNGLGTLVCASQLIVLCFSTNSPCLLLRNIIRSENVLVV